MFSPHNPSVMQHAFSRVPTVSSPRSVFNRSHGYKTTFDGGFLIPFFVDEVCPGDSVNLKCTALIRILSPLIHPIMDNLYADTFFFFVPNRLLWTNWVKFMGEQDNPADSISYLVPQITSPNVAAGGVAIGHLYDYMGIPTGALSGGGSTTGITFNNLHGRAYNQIWNAWFRSQDLQNSVTKDVGDGPDTYTNYNLLRRGKRHDYFTSALPFLQKGTAVSLPLGSTAPVYGGTLTAASNFNAWQGWNSTDAARQFGTLSKTTGGITAELSGGGWTGMAGTDVMVGLSLGTAADYTSLGASYAPPFADLSLATAASVNTLRAAVSLQHFLEQDARGGTRYPELNKSHFGVTNPDSRVQRPELLSTYSSAIKINPVADTAGTAEDQGYLGAFGTGVSANNGFTKSFTEHGVLIGLMSVRADLTYQLGLDRMWSRRTRYDYPWPILANLGEQAILNKEIYANLLDGTGAAQKDGTFGYIPRYDERRFKLSKITGDLRSTAAGALDSWHLSQVFSTQPVLNAGFIQDDPPIDRIIRTPSEPHFVMDVFFDMKHAQVLPVFAVPGLKML